MARNVPLELVENNDQVIAVSITPEEGTEDLSAVTLLELYLKTAPSYTDNDPSTFVLTSADVAEIEIDTQTAQEITARAFIPRIAVVAPYNRFWHFDAIGASGTRRTAFYGKVDVINV